MEHHQVSQRYATMQPHEAERKYDDFNGQLTEEQIHAHLTGRICSAVPYMKVGLSSVLAFDIDVDDMPRAAAVIADVTERPQIAAGRVDEPSSRGYVHLPFDDVTTVEQLTTQQAFGRLNGRLDESESSAGGSTPTPDPQTPPAASGTAGSKQTPASQGTPARYVRVPQRLLASAVYHPLLVGVYSLVAHLFLVVQAPVPLSAADIIRYDPALSRGAAQRALSRLVDDGWLIATDRAGQKSTYVPAWGRVHGVPVPWRIGTPCLDRPRHVRAVCLDLRLLDLYLGKLTPHPKRAAVITRYVTAPLLGLTDVGSYALLLGGLPGATPHLVAWDLVHDELPLPLLDDDVILALASQRRLVDGSDITLTARGLQKVGLIVPSQPTDSPHPLFFVPPDVIDDWPTRLPTNVIDSTHDDEASFPPLQSQNTPEASAASPITWESLGTHRNQREFPPNPPLCEVGGGALPADDERTVEDQDSQRTTNMKTPTVARSGPIPLDTEAARALATINVLPNQIAELADMPLTIVNDAIRDGQVRPYVRDLAGWVVTLLRAHRDHGWTITPPVPQPDSSEALRAAFARYAAEQEAQHCDEMDEDQPWSAPLTPAMYDRPDARILLWNEVLSMLQLQLPRQEFDAWIRPAVLHSITGGIATIVVPSVLAKEAIEHRYLASLRDLLTMQVGEAVTVRIILRGAQSDEESPAPLLRDQIGTSLHTQGCGSLEPERGQATTLTPGALIVGGAYMHTPTSDPDSMSGPVGVDTIPLHMDMWMPEQRTIARIAMPLPIRLQHRA